MKMIILYIFVLISTLLIPQELESILKSSSNLISPPNISGVFNLKLISKSKDVRQYNATAYQKRVSDKQENRIFIFNYPPSVKDTGLLVHSFFDDSDTRMWLYLPVVKRIKRIALNTSGGGYFMGSDFTYSDLISRSSEDFNYSLLGEDSIEGEPCYKIKAQGITRKRQESIGYLYTINYYRKIDNLLIAIDYYDMAEDLVKQYRVLDVATLGEYLYPSKVIMTNIRFEHTSIIEFTNLSIDDIPDEYFTHLYLKEK
jgi:hypothetical protein